ncbi:MAG: arginine--tRNA ligase [Chloroflexota bacterium]|nr:arginine--tRNA ligase [Chloroflexota bacterium]
MFEAKQQSIAAQIQAYCRNNDIPAPDEVQWRPIPSSGDWGISTSFFQTAAQEARSGKKVNVPARAQEIAESAAAHIGTPTGIERVGATKGYLNFYFDPGEFGRSVVDTVLEEGDDFGRGDPKDERVMVEYAQPNTHHSFHIGHYRNTILGEALARLVEFAGFDTVRSSYPGDIGLGVITVMWAYDKFYKDQEPDGIHERGQWLLNIYIEATKLLAEKEDETPAEKARREVYDAERREMYRKWDAGDTYVRDLWRETRAWSLEELRDILRMIGVEIDVWFFESDVDEPSKQIVEELLEKGIADDERADGGAVIVKIDEKLGLKKEKYRTNVILRNDGTTLYLTKDLALAKEKFEKYHVDRSIYVVDARQSLHLQQTFAILKLWGFPQAAKCHHLGYGFVSLPEGAMSARSGRVVLFEDVADEAVRRVLGEIEQKNPDMPQEWRHDIAQQIGLGALAYAMLSVDNNKDIVFDIDEALSFDGHTGPYIQNAHVRASSILRKADEFPAQASFDYELSSHEIELIEAISRFPDKVEQAADEYRPLVIASYAFNLAATFHSFYHVVPVLQTGDSAIRDARLRLVAAAKQTIVNALRLLVIQAPDVM